MLTGERRYWLGLLGIWLASAVALIALEHKAIASFHFWDPDDAMRLLEVRDWLGGQSWFDVSQHRMNLPDGLSMHWSRLLDLPLAGVIVALRPLFGERAAETAAAVIIPLVTLGATMTLVAQIARRRSGAGAGLLAGALTLTSIGAWYAMLPMRIDHHGWQIVAGLGMAYALIFRSDLRGTVIAGLCAAAWIHISLEGLAFTAGAAAWLGLLWIGGAAQPRHRLPVFLATLSLAETILYLTVHGTGLLHQTFCDQLSPVHIGMFMLGAALSFAATAANPRHRIARLAILLPTALTCAAWFRLGAPQCAAGPFATLGPLGHDLWYRSVPEGVPLWHLAPNMQLLWGIFPWVGLLGAVVTWRGAETGRIAHLTYCVLLGWATLIALLVMRTGAFANLLAIPGAVGLILSLARKTEALPMLPRVLARTAGILLLCPAGAESASLFVTASQEATSPKPAADPKCGLIDTLHPLDQLAPATIIVPLELGPNLLAGTHHRAITGPYHRDPAALEDVLRFFTAPDARDVAVRRNATYLAFCPARGEMGSMAKFAPHGLAARLLRGERPAWLKPVRVPQGHGLELYRIIP